MTFKAIARKFIPGPLLGAYHYILAFLGAVIFACLPAGRVFGSDGIKIIGVTGTSGKSTTVDFITRILEEGGYKVASTSTARFKVAEKEWENKYKMTMPGRFVIQKFLKQAKDAGCKFVVLEVTSEGIRQFRHKFINFDAAVFTNLSKEHIESHGSFENYRDEKLKLFRAVKNIHIINTDDPNAKYFMENKAKMRVTFGINDAKDLKISEDGLSFGLQNTTFNLHVAGQFNVYNSLAAIAVGGIYGVPLSVCARALEKAKGVAGRMEIVHKNPTVVVDYAHTPEQLEAVYKTFSGKSLICVLGSCGGGRDKWKRPVLGEIARKYCQKIIVTNEDPYDEDPMEIINQVTSGITPGVDGKTPGVEKILDRKEAITTAIKKADKNDVVVITGKGSEPWLCVKNGRKIPWDDRAIAKDALRDV